jgi:hypothetical protein
MVTVEDENALVDCRSAGEKSRSRRAGVSLASMMVGEGESGRRLMSVLYRIAYKVVDCPQWIAIIMVTSRLCMS